MARASSAGEEGAVGEGTGMCVWMRPRVERWEGEMVGEAGVALLMGGGVSGGREGGGGRWDVRGGRRSSRLSLLGGWGCDLGDELRGERWSFCFARREGRLLLRALRASWRRGLPGGEALTPSVPSVRMLAFA